MASGVKGTTPPHLVGGVITEHGILSPYDLARFYGQQDQA
jgi:methylthioribose-1-phosphate isomerase